MAEIENGSDPGSTRAENPGYTPSERTVGEAFREIMEPLSGRVIVATFASNIARLPLHKANHSDFASPLRKKILPLGHNRKTSQFEQSGLRA